MGSVYSVWPQHPQIEQVAGASESCGLHTAHLWEFCIKNEGEIKEETEENERDGKEAGERLSEKGSWTHIIGGTDTVPEERAGRRSDGDWKGQTNCLLVPWWHWPLGSARLGPQVPVKGTPCRPCSRRGQATKQAATSFRGRTS